MGSEEAMFPDARPVHKVYVEGFWMDAAPVTNDRSPRYMERALAAIHQAHPERGSIAFLYAATEGRVFFDSRNANRLPAPVKSRLKIACPGSLSRAG